MTLGTGAPPYIRLKGRATDFVPHPEGLKSRQSYRSLTIRPKARERRDFHADRLCVRINIRLGQPDPKRSNAVEGGNAVEDCMRQRLLQIVPPCSSELGNLGTEEVIVPRFRGMIVGWRLKIVKPDLNIHQKPLRRTDLKVVEPDVGLDLEPF